MTEKTSQDHAEDIATTVQQRGLCIFWSDIFDEKIAFIRDLRFLGHVPKGIPIYTSAELKELFEEGKPKLKPEALKLLHEAKKAGGVVTSYEKQEKLL